MLRIKTVKTDEPPAKEVIEIRGEPITFWLRPWDADTARRIRAKHIRGFEWQQDARGRKEKVEILDTDGYFDEMVEYIIAGFEGVGDESGAAWPVDLDHKKKLIAISVEKGAVPVWEAILDRAQALAFVKAETEAGEEKN